MPRRPGATLTASRVFEEQRMSQQLSLFGNEGVLPVPGWHARTPPEMADAAPAGYRLNLGGEEPAYEPVDGDGSSTDEETDESLSADQRRYAPREWAPYCADTIALKGTIRKPAARLSALWVCTGSSGRANDGGQRNARVYRLVPLADYVSPHPDLPLGYREHTALPAEHPFRWGYEGMLVSWQGKPHVITDEHAVFSHPYIPDPEGHGFLPDPDWHPQDEDAVRTDSNPWRDDPTAWQATRRLIG